MRGLRHFVMMMFAGCALIQPLASARVVRVEIESTEQIAGGQSFGRSGAYERITGRIHLEVDPDNPANRLIVDLDLAPRNERGNVEFSDDFELQKPLEPQRGNRRLIYFVNNRGNKASVRGAFHAGGGENWLYRQGWSFLWCGWNCDAIVSDKRMNIYVPVVEEKGKTITGKIYAEICTTSSNKTYSMPFYWGGSIAYPVISLDNSHATLTVRSYRTDEPLEVPRDLWVFARWENNAAVPAPGHLYIKDGFKPGWLYDLVYVGRDPKLTGLGFAAIRDVTSFFKYEQVDEKNNANPLAGAVEYAYAFGISQSGRVIYHFLYQDFNGDEERRMVFDGVMPHVTSRRQFVSVGLLPIQYGPAVRPGDRRARRRFGQGQGLWFSTQGLLHRLVHRVLDPLGFSDSHRRRRQEGRPD
jgi:hypothetical protein